MGFVPELEQKTPWFIKIAVFVIMVLVAASVAIAYCGGR